MTRIKMCGMTTPEDAVEAARLGAHAVGLVFWPDSPRHVSVPAAARIAAALPPFVARVGVFVDPSAGEVERARDEVGIDTAQIHGAAPAWQGGRPPVALVRAVHLSDTDPDLIEPACEAGAAVLLDAWDPIRHGGTGRTIDWGAAARVARRRPIVLAGGLTAENVGEAIRVVRPYGVDVASGIEREPGVKDWDRMRRFVDAVREAS